MTAFRYRALRPDGSWELGTLAAGSHRDASAALAARGIFPIELSADTRLGNGNRGRSGRRLSAHDMAVGLRMLATLLEAGLPLSRAIAAFADVAPDSWRPAFPNVIDALRDGHSLAVALREAPLQLPELVLGMIEAGEAGGKIALAVLRAAELSEGQASLRTAIRAALAYPLLLTGAGLASTALLVGIVLPRFATILGDLGQALPPTTALVLAVAERARVLTLPALAITVSLAALWHFWTTSAAGRARWHALLLWLPVVGAVRRSTGTARACGAAASLLDSGVAMPVALRLAARASGDAAIASRLLAVRTDVVHGASLAGSLAGHDAVTLTAVRLVRAGEESGRLSAMLGHAARVEAEWAGVRVKAAVRLLEPTLLLGFGALVALVAAAMLQAVYSIRPVP